MIFYLIQGVRTPGKVDIIHHLLFHGDMERSDFKITDKYSHFLGEDLSQPVLLTRSGSFIPPLFQPGTSFVVTQKVFSEMVKNTVLNSTLQRSRQCQTSKLISTFL